MTMTRKNVAGHLETGLFVIFVVFGWLESSNAAVITVTNAADSGAGSFRGAIADAQENDTINFAPKVRGTITLTTGELLISKALTIQGPGANLLTIDANYASRLLRIDVPGSAVLISALTF